MFENIAQIEKEVQEFRTNILASKELLQHLEDLTEAVNKEHEALVEKMVDLQASVERHTTDNTQRVSVSVDSLLKGHEKAADDLATEIHATVENLRQGNAENLSRLQAAVSAATDKNSEALRAISQKYEDFLAKIESSNLEHIYEYCSKLEHSINQKFMILGVGIGVTAVLAILSIIL